jgi:hypothetical protein
VNFYTFIYECRCDERLKATGEGSTRLGYTGLCGGLEHLKIETRLINERFVSVMGECDLQVIGVSSIFKFTRKDATLVRMNFCCCFVVCLLLRRNRELKIQYNTNTYRFTCAG